MSASVNPGLPTDPAVLSAVVAAVQAYIDDEERASGRGTTRATAPTAALSAWKSAAWHPIRGGSHRGPPSWRHPA